METRPMRIRSTAHSIVLALLTMGLACSDPDPDPAGSDGTDSGESTGDPTPGGSSGTGGSGTAGSSSSTGGAPGTTGDATDSGGTGGGGNPSSGCGVDWTPADVELDTQRNGPTMQVARRTMEVAGATREYLVAAPEVYDFNRAYPLVFGFHGGSGDREQLRRYMNVENPADGNAIMIYPSGPVLEDRGTTGWDLDADSDDLLFVDALIEKYTGELCIDETQIFATGHSFGGCMSNTVGCFRGDVFRAIAPVAGCGPFSRASCVGQVATLQIHSPLDTATDYGGAVSACTRYLRASGCSEQPACGCHWVDEVEDPADECIQEAQQPYETTVDVGATNQDDQAPVLREYLECDPLYPVVFADHWHREGDVGDPDERWHNPPPWSENLIWEFFVNLPPLGSRHSTTRQP